VKSDNFENFFVEVVDQTDKGDGVAYFNLKNVRQRLIIPNTLRGDRGIVQISASNKNAYFGRILALLTKSVDRIEPRCLLAEKCGGCQLQHQKYSSQLAFKRKIVSEAFSMYSTTTGLFIHDVLPNQNSFNYRNKFQCAIQRDNVNNSKINIGLYTSNTNHAIDTEECFIQHPLVNEVLKKVRFFIEKHNVSVYHEKTRLGSLRHLVVRVGFETNETMVCLVSATDDSQQNKKEFIDEISKIKNVKSILFHVNNDPSDQILSSSNNNQILYGKDFITDVVAGVKVRISLHSFVQSNPRQATELYKQILNIGNFNKNDTVYDFYCGVGTIGLFLSKFVKTVVGVEDCAPAIVDADLNKNLNNIQNIQFYCDKAEHFVNNLVVNKSNSFKNNSIVFEQENSFKNYSIVFEQENSVLILNPPRKGCEKNLLEKIKNIKFKKIVYVSCNPKTLARDLNILLQNNDDNSNHNKNNSNNNNNNNNENEYTNQNNQIYEVATIKPVDMFSHSYHVEVVVLLTLK
jgi:23S rRNA (uracil1939-C5)-methyltransferase